MNATDESPPCDEVPGGGECDLYHGIGFWVAVLVGGLAVTYGVSEYLDVYDDVERRLALPKWIVGSAVAHDLLLAPMVLAIGLGISRLVPAGVRAPVQFGSIVSGMVLLIAWHPLRHTAAAKNNPSIQPLDYRKSTLVVLVVVWLISGAWAAARARPSGDRGARRWRGRVSA